MKTQNKTESKTPIVDQRVEILEAQNLTDSHRYGYMQELARELEGEYRQAIAERAALIEVENAARFVEGKIGITPERLEIALNHLDAIRKQNL